ncbi:hypothetical protein Ppa06_54450 [Planomonospora parontospora subsp. parontospora]|uniref:G domain-containing protein n=2 Tax=Planomonospora parontospora TaxID=58119 RepID=A0AA37BL68_9ACTN|nr:GTPase [Planomonospora parontospora]GGK88992.1 hypothetical protein GCM10010126_55520 [Planomonospora parontospora]GII11647.1 hypothetical protein Ppa06_54450 [Planomonospora parontospora subsp. parontospora]
MKSAADKPVHPAAEDGPRLGVAREEEPEGAFPGRAESPGEQTLTFQAIRADEEGVPAGAAEAEDAGDPPADPGADGGQTAGNGPDSAPDDGDVDQAGPDDADDSADPDGPGALDGSGDSGGLEDPADPDGPGGADGPDEDDAVVVVADLDGSGEENGATPEGRVRDEPLPDEVSEALTGALAALRDSVTDLAFGLDLPGVEEARKARAEILAQLDDYVIPRIHMSTAPALIVVAGSTGAGKSTLLNTLANADVSPTGVRRPTTGTPVLACHPDDHEWFAEGGLLGSLERRGASEPGTGTDGLVLVTTERLPPGVALLDTPDIDSVVEAHHEIAHRMLDAADLWIFVTTAARYADAPAWRLLRLAKERGARLAIVLSRVPARSREVVTKHFVRMLTEYGLGQVDRFVINESKAADGMLPDHEVTELRLWLTELSVDDRRRAQAVQATLAGVLDSFRARVPALARQLEVQLALRAELRGDVDAAYGGAMAEIDEATRNGSLLRGEVLARWQDFIGSGDLMRTLHLRKPGRFAGKASHQGPERLSALKTALRTGLEAVVVSAAQRAAEETVARWLNRPGAGETLAAVPGLGEPSDDLPRRAGRAVAAWQDHLVGLIRTEGVTKRSVARLVSFDADSLAVILAIGMFGYGTAEVEVAGKSALPQRLLHALLGAESLRNISAKARSDLRTRIGTLFDDEVWRYVQALDGAGVPDESAATRLYQAMYNLEVAR